MKFIVTGLLFCLINTLQAQLPDTPVIFPKPQQMQLLPGNFLLSNATTIVADGAAKPIVALFISQLKMQSGLNLRQAASANKNVIRFSFTNKIQPGPAGQYALTVGASNITITANRPEGIFYGMQTLLQLAAPAAALKTTDVKVKTSASFTVPCLNIYDEPRFAYRGMHLDVSRHFFNVAYIKKYIDYLAAYKFNTFHWHLTDDQGWRIEIKKYPKLTNVGGYRNGTIIGRYPGKGNDGLRYGGFYTQEQIKEVVKYAAERYISVIPEIEMPGHASAAIAAYPQLSCFPDESTKHPPQCAWAGDTTGKQVQQTWGVFDDVFCPGEYTFHFLEDVLDEVMPLFPSRYIHIGGDECPKTAWERSAFCQQLMKEKGLKNAHELQSYFIQRMEKYVNSKGRRIIGWDEILEGGLAPNATVMSWQGEKGGIAAAQQAHDVIMTPSNYVYFDHSQTKSEDSVTIGGYLPLETVYNYDPVPAVLNTDGAKHILGAQANLWAEYITNPAKVEYMLFPRMAALSEVLWTKKENKSWDDFEKRLPALFERLNDGKVNYSKTYLEPIVSIISGETLGEIKLQVTSRKPSSILGFFKTTNVNGLTKKVPVTSVGHVSEAINSNVLIGILPESYISIEPILTLNFLFNKATGKKITLINEPSKNYPGNGAFTLVDGIQNDRRLERSTEFLGFNGQDCETMIDIGKQDTISKIIVHCLNQQPSWVYPPKTIEVSISSDGNQYSAQPVYQIANTQPGNNSITVLVNNTVGRYVKIKMMNHGIIDAGMPGAGSPAWLMVDEVEVW